ncbi:MAG: hypothetical protein QCI82_06865 [Candidatus Thermoplasmatota archaeon]|nr:hypothetical protein [Candidatus Thermoplasmatota archaeon]
MLKGGSQVSYRELLYPSSCGAIVAVLVISGLFILSGGSFGHPAASMALDYNIDNSTLAVSITHNTPTPNYHYIETVEVSKNGAVYSTNTYTSQPTQGTFTYYYTVPAVDGDVLSVRTVCNLAGEMTEEMTVTGPRQDMRIEVSPSITGIEEGQTRDFTINAYSGTETVDGVSFRFEISHGSVSEVEALGLGGYQFTYEAPEVETDVTETMTITGSRNGYNDSSASLSFTISDSDIPDDRIRISLMPQTKQVASGAEVSFIVSLSVQDGPVTGAQVSVEARIGSVGAVTEKGGGDYEFTYTAPVLDSDDEERITIDASRDPYEKNDARYEFDVLASTKDATLDGVIGGSEYEYKATAADGDLEIHWRIEGENIRMAIRGRTTGWISIGLEPTTLMKDADMIIGWVDGSGAAHILDCFSQGNYGPHPPDTEIGGTDDILEFGGSQSGGWTVIEFTRKLVTGDRYDKPIDPQGVLKLIWALGDEDDHTSQHAAAQARRGYLEIDLATGDSSERKAPVLWPVHAIFMTGGLVLMAASTIILYTSRKTKWWLKAHKGAGVAGAISTVIGLAVGIYMVGRAGSGHLGTLHSILGGITAVMLLSSPALGFIHFKFIRRTRNLRPVHIWLSRIALLLMFIVIVMGLFLIGIFD